MRDSGDTLDFEGPPFAPNHGGFHFRTNAKAISKGLTFRPLAVTALDTLEWNKTRSPEDRQAQIDGKLNGLAPAREAEVLAAWKAKPR